MRHASALSGCALLLALAPAATALATPPLATPWPCDVTYSITQGHNGGSHVDEGSWAWDIGVPEGADVAAPADGVVRMVRMDSTEGGCSSAFGNSANYVIVDFMDGTEALFLHLAPNSSTLAVGDAVSQGDVVGKVGLTGWVCGAHLHFQIQNTCASWWCQSIPSSFVDYGDPAPGTMVVSNNCPVALPCPVVGEGTTTIDELSSCFVRETSYWWHVDEGDAGHHYYTFGTDAAADETIGHYRFDVAVDGLYRIEVFIPSTDADSENAQYKWSNGGELQDLGVVNQAREKGWVALGEVALTAGAAREVYLGDKTGEPYDLMRRLAFDAIRLTKIDPSGEGGGNAGGASAGTGGESAASGGSDPVGGDGAAADGDDTDAEDGCSCATAGDTGGLRWPGIALLALMWARSGSRRRARSRD
jgi:murein DD-endopeptidase MepM/ murein hydrolase activator NlpD